MTDSVAEAVEAGDLDRLVRLVDGLCSAREWPEVVRLRDRCRRAVERGLQLWPASEYAEYRLALHAPAEYAGPVVTERAGRFALGPLWEVAASTHTWAELARHVPGGPARAMAAHERVIRGEDLTGAPEVDPMILEIPLRLERWEPAYRVATYRSSEADFPAPEIPALVPAELPPPGPAAEDPEAAEALFDLARVWVEQSNGSCRIAVVEGSAEQAVAALGHREVRVGEAEAAGALAWMAWTGASGGAYGRRRGSPVGRFSAWWAAAALTGLAWPADPAELGARAAGLRWLLWEPAGSVSGWGLHLAVEHGEEGVAWAVAAADGHREGEPAEDAGRAPVDQ